MGCIYFQTVFTDVVSKLVVSNMAAVVEGDPKGPFSIATTQRCREGATPFPGLLHFTLIRTLYCWVLSKEVSSTIFKVFGKTWPGMDQGLPGHYRTLYPLGQWAGYLSSRG